MSDFVVAHMAVGAGQPFLWVADRDPLGQAVLLWVGIFGCSGGAAFISCVEVISVHPDGIIVMKTSTSAKVTSGSIAHTSSCTLPARQ